MLLGWLVVVSGLVETVHAYHLRGTGGFFFHIIPGIAGVPIGLLIATHPSAGYVAWMLVFASYFTVLGLFRSISAFRLKFPTWEWSVFDGTVTVLLGALFWTTWPWLVSWFFGLAVGISLMMRGWSSIMFGIRRGRAATPRTHVGVSEWELHRQLQRENKGIGQTNAKGD
jgi:uncharacterized membrane protein HdeD (DUF308 family)